jgi:2-polyprenyl-3-methyl-5-hydroxy-6-metoxy-1,4-benzoquinol methylase
VSDLVARICWCGATTAHPLGTFPTGVGTFALVQCDGCGVQALDPQPTDAQLTAAYASDYYGATRRKFIWPISSLVGLFQNRRARMAAKWLPKGGRILDIGCGNGGFLAQMQDMGFAVEGTEWSAHSAARVPAECSIAVHVGDLLSLDLPRQAYDLITLWHVFEHLRQPREALLRIGDLLAPSGALIMSMPNAESWQARMFGTHWFHHDPPRHLFAFGRSSLTQLLNLTGFEVKAFHSFSMEQNPYGLIQSMLNAWGFPRDRAYTVLKGLSHQRLGTRVVDLSLAGFLTTPAIAHSIVESKCGKGATMTIIAKRQS